MPGLHFAPRFLVSNLVYGPNPQGATDPGNLHFSCPLGMPGCFLTPELSVQHSPDKAHMGLLFPSAQFVSGGCHTPPMVPQPLSLWPLISSRPVLRADCHLSSGRSLIAL